MSTMKLVIFTLLVGAIMADDADPTAAAPPPAPDAGTPLAWVQFGHRYFAPVPSPMNWCEAQKMCLANHGSLASIQSQEENNFVSTLAGGQRAWIGFSNAQNESAWLWIDSSHSGFTGWCENKPDPGNDHCALINFSVNNCWDNQPCNIPYPAVCSKNNK